MARPKKEFTMVKDDNPQVFEIKSIDYKGYVISFENKDDDSCRVVISQRGLYRHCHVFNNQEIDDCISMAKAYIDERAI